MLSCLNDLLEVNVVEGPYACAIGQTISVPLRMPEGSYPNFLKIKEAAVDFTRSLTSLLAVKGLCP